MKNVLLTIFTYPIASTQQTRLTVMTSALYQMHQIVQVNIHISNTKVHQSTSNLMHLCGSHIACIALLLCGCSRQHIFLSDFKVKAECSNYKTIKKSFQNCGIFRCLSVKRLNGNSILYIIRFLRELVKKTSKPQKHKSIISSKSPACQQKSIDMYVLWLKGNRNHKTR